MHSSSDPYHLVPVIAASGDAPMTGSVRDLKLHAESQAEKADADRFQQRLTCRGPASLQFWSHDLASTALRATGKQAVPRNGADFPTLKERIEVFTSTRGKVVRNESKTVKPA